MPEVSAPAKIPKTCSATSLTFSGSTARGSCPIPKSSLPQRRAGPYSHSSLVDRPETHVSVGVRCERETVVRRATDVPRLAKPARHARYARDDDLFRLDDAITVRIAPFTQRRKRIAYLISAKGRFSGMPVVRATSRSTLAS